MSDFLTPAQATEALAEFQKAIAATPYAYQGNGALVREDLSSELVIMAPRDTPLRNRFKRVPGNGGAHAFYRLLRNSNTSIGTFFGTTPSNAVFAKGGLPTDTTETYQYVSVPYYNLGDNVIVPFQDQAQGRSYEDIMALRTKVKMMNVGMIEEYFIINGNSTTAQSGGGYIWDGLVNQIQATGGAAGQPGGQAFVSPDGRITLDYIREVQYLQWFAGGSPSCVVMSGYSRAILQKQVAQIYNIHQVSGGASMSGMSGGISTDSWDFGYGECDFITSRYINPDPYSGLQFVLSLDDQTLDQKNDGNVIQMIDVDPLHSVDLALLGTSWRKVIYETSTLQVSAPAFQGIITGLSFYNQTPITG